VDLSNEGHTIHLHLVQFQIVSRQNVNATKYATDWIALQRQALGNETATPPWPTNFIPKELSVEPYLLGKPTPTPENEQGWKDTVLTYPYTVTIIRVRFASQDGSPFPFDATQGPGYVWHCHLLDHEDNEMMRPYKVVSAGAGAGSGSSNNLVFIAPLIIATSLVVIFVLILYFKRKTQKSKKTTETVPSHLAHALINPWVILSV